MEIADTGCASNTNRSSGKVRTISNGTGHNRMYCWSQVWGQTGWILARAPLVLGLFLFIIEFPPISEAFLLVFKTCVRFLASEVYLAIKLHRLILYLYKGDIHESKQSPFRVPLALPIQFEEALETNSYDRILTRSISQERDSAISSYVVWE